MNDILDSTLLQAPSSTTRRQSELPMRAAKIWQQYWTHEDTFASVLLTLFLDHYGLEALEWAPETIRMQIEEDFNVQLPTVNLDKLLAAILVVTSNVFYKDLVSFIQLCNVLSGHELNLEVFDPADSAEMAWAITEVLLLDPPEEPEPFSSDIRDYIGYMLREEGYVTAPDVLRIGLNTDLSQSISQTFADDPEMFQAIHESQIAKADEINHMLTEQLQDLQTQLQGLPLKNGSADGLLQKLQEGSHESTE